jgi:hypothetical protein
VRQKTPATSMLATTSTGNCTYFFLKAPEIANGSKKQINWLHLSQLRKYSAITEADHMSLDPVMILPKKKGIKSQMESMQEM